MISELCGRNAVEWNYILMLLPEKIPVTPLPIYKTAILNSYIWIMINFLTALRKVKF